MDLKTLIIGNHRKLVCKDIRREWPPTDKLKDLPGVYVVAMRPESPKARIARLGDVDDQGIVYIGQSGTLRSRLRTLRLGLMNEKPNSHPMSFRYARYPNIQQLLPIEDLVFRYDHCAKSGKSDDGLLLQYIEKFGEVPPLNAKWGKLEPDAD